MYDYPERRAATDAWAAGIARFADVDVGISRESDCAAAWRRNDLAFSQTCGYPVTHEFQGKLSLIGTPHYAVRGCDGFCYSSFVFGRKGGDTAQYRGAVASINTTDSMSGMLALRLFFNGQAKAGAFFKNTVISGAHLNSLALLQRSEADFISPFYGSGTFIISHLKMAINIFQNDDRVIYKNTDNKRHPQQCH